MWAWVRGHNSVCSGLAQRIPPGSSNPSRMASHPSSQGPSGSTGSALAVLVRATAPPLARGSLAPQLQDKAARLGWGLFSWKSWPDLLCAHPCCPILQVQTEYCHPEPTPQPLVWAGNRSPQAPVRQIRVCPANPFCCSDSKPLCIKTWPRGRAAAQTHSCWALPSPAATGRW